jgi:ATP-dependent helicase/nuclease subunit B
MSGFLDSASPRWFTIGAHRPFLEDLAKGVWRALGPEALAEAVILIPTRRAARSLAEAFLKAAGAKAVLLPQIRALGDLDEGEPPFEAGDITLDLAPAISSWRRRFELARLVVENEELLERRLDAGSALELADALAVFLDGCQIEETGDPAAVETLVEGELARHWQVSAKFLNLALEAWPKRLAALGLVDVAERRVGLLRALAARWRDHPPADVLIAAGSTGAAPAAADLLAAIAQAPRGCVVLPGLDKSLADTAWEEVDEPHPQGALKRLLARSGITRLDVRDWDPAKEANAWGRWRRRVINEALRPPNATADWLHQIAALRAESAAAGVDPIVEGLAGLASLTAGGEEEAATVAALLLRETLETPGKTAALITPDAALARRVSARLTRWNITADSSAGQPLAAAPVAVLASLVAHAGADPADPVTLLAIVKHPLTRLGLDEETLERGRRALERHCLRGPRPDGWDALNVRLREAVDEDPEAGDAAERRNAALAEAIDLAARLRAALDLAQAPFAEEAAPAAAVARALLAAMEALAGGPRDGLGELWTGQAGECAAGLFAALLEESDGLPDVTRAGFAQLLDALMARELVRPGGASHPRLRILGVLEARLIRADRLILAGLEEGVWPRAAPIDPFLSRPMRAKLGLPPPERRIGLSAHDFAQAAAAPEVILINSERRAGAPAVASRWLWRLRTLAKGAGVELPGRPEILQWARALDAPLIPPPQSLRTAARPRPAPPLAARPRAMSVTAVERWVRDPYAIYARDVLKLRPLAAPDEPIEAMARGSAIHAAFERFAREHPDVLPDDAEERFAAMVIEELARAGMPAPRMTREHALAANVAPWVIAFERRRRPGARLVVETRGEHVFDAPGGPFKLTARADRIEARGELADILDFKTGATPTAKQMRAGLSPQLTLTGAILARGGFADLGAARPGDLLYVRVGGGRIPGREELRGVAGESEALADAALEGLKRRVALFDRAETPYPSWAAPQFIGRQGGDYDHLARLWEWHVIGEGEAEGGP